MGRSAGWAGTLSPRGPGMGFPLGCGFLLGIRVSDGPVEGEYSTSVLHLVKGFVSHFAKSDRASLDLSELTTLLRGEGAESSPFTPESHSTAIQ